MLKLTQELFGPQDPDTARIREQLTAEQFSAMMQAVVSDFGAYFRGITEDRRRNPRDDLATVIANARLGGDYMPDHDTTSYYMIVATAGHDTTSSSTAGAIWALAEDPEQFARVKADPDLVPGLVDEAIRWMTPVKHFMRAATADTELGGRQIAKGDWLMLCYASGNRDEDVFPNADEFVMNRPNIRDHIAFGRGPHNCPGAPLARLELRVTLEELLKRTKGFVLDGPIKQTRCPEVGALSVPLRFT